MEWGVSHIQINDISKSIFVGLTGQSEQRGRFSSDFLLNLGGALTKSVPREQKKTILKKENAILDIFVMSKIYFRPREINRVRAYAATFFSSVEGY